VAGGEGPLGLGHGVGGAAHGLNAAGDVDVALAGLDGARGLVDGVQARRAQPVEGHAGHMLGETGQQHGHARHVAVVLAGLVGAAQVDLLHQGRVETGSLNNSLEGNRGQVVRPHRSQHAAVAAHGSTNRIDDHCVGHKSSGLQVAGCKWQVQYVQPAICNLSLLSICFAAHSTIKSSRTMNACADLQGFRKP
jgi:hypothetical protein